MGTGKKFHYLALGDSYTIGEAVPYAQNFPNQLVNFLAGKGLTFQTPRIIAVTGWTTDELEKGIEISDKSEPLLPAYDLVTLLIGVNDQYRGRTADDYKPRFEALLKIAISFAGNNHSRVIVLSIPDWGVTPFATGRNRKQIAKEIDDFNAVNREIAAKYHVHYLDITAWTREAAENPDLLAADGLHPSGKEYDRWGKKLSELVQTIFL